MGAALDEPRRIRASPASTSKPDRPAYGPTPDFSGPFRIKAGYLLAARVEDSLALPAHREDPLTAELAQMIYSDLRHDGLPER